MGNCSPGGNVLKKRVVYPETSILYCPERKVTHPGVLKKYTCNSKDSKHNLAHPGANIRSGHNSGQNFASSTDTFTNIWFTENYYRNEHLDITGYLCCGY
jgi:hypothetical protein